MRKNINFWFTLKKMFFKSFKLSFEKSATLRTLIHYKYSLGSLCLISTNILYGLHHDLRMSASVSYWAVTRQSPCMVAAVTTIVNTLFHITINKRQLWHQWSLGWFYDNRKHIKSQEYHFLFLIFLKLHCK